MHAKTSYDKDDIVWGARFRDMYLADTDHVAIDLTRLHDFEPLARPNHMRRCSSACVPTPTRGFRKSNVRSRVYGSLGQTIGTTPENGAGTTISGGVTFLVDTGSIK